MNGRLAQLLILASALAFAPGAFAAEEITSTLSLDELVAAALRDNPQLRALRARWEAMGERPAQERTLPNPMFSYMGMDEVDRHRFPDTNERRLELQQQFPWFGKLGLRGKVAEKDAEATEHMYWAAAREVVMMIKESYFDLFGVQQALTITRGEKDVLSRMQKIAETKYSTGTASQPDVLKAQAEISMLGARLLELEQQEVTIKARINTLLNRPPESSLGLAVTPPQAEFEGAYERLQALAREHRHEIDHAQVEIQREQHRRDLMKKEFFPDYRLGIEYRNFDRGEDMVMFTVGVDLPIWQRKYRAGVREAEKMIESSKAALDAVERQTSFDVRDAHFKALTAQRTVALYRTALVPQAEMRFQASEAGYRTGKVDFLDLLESERFLLNARVMLAMAEGNLGMQLARLERAVGTDLNLNANDGGNKK